MKRKKTQKQFKFNRTHRVNAFRLRYPELFEIPEKQTNRMPRGGNILVRLYEDSAIAHAIAERRREKVHEYLEIHPHLRDAFSAYCEMKTEIKFEVFLRQFKTRPPLFSKYRGLRLVVDNTAIGQI
jgi:hypothetical protein